ncbi:MAG: hypothetical protein JXR20_12425 [Balneola sp.]
MSFKKFRVIVLLIAFIAPICIQIYQGYSVAKSSYNGTCGLLDASWECSWLEYYSDFIIGPFVIFSLFGYYAVSLILAVTILFLYKKWFVKSAQET